MRVKRVVINGLFGIFTHEISFHNTERITIIHGPNGVGKTTILKLISDLFSKRFHTLYVTPFSSMMVEFQDENTVLAIERNEKAKDAETSTLKFTLHMGSKKQEFSPKHPRELFGRLYHDFPPHMIEDQLDMLERVEPRRWYDRSTGEILDLDDVIAIYGDRLSFFANREASAFPPWFEKLLSSVPTHFIQTQRLFALPELERRNRPSQRIRKVSTVDRYSEEMVEQVRNILRESAVLGASLDRTFPQRLLEKRPPKEATEKAIRIRYESQTQYRERLMKAGLIDPEAPVSLPPGNLDRNARTVLWHYLNDVESKFKVFGNLLERVELFKEIINTRFLYKTFAVDKDKGFSFYSMNNEPVPLRVLSSGEQHELVLAFELLFRVKEKSLILIDEPELSLHVTWQHKFLDDIGQISRLADLDFLVATHSPSIIHNRSDLMIPLGGQ